MTIEVEKSFALDYAHRVHTQTLSGGKPNKCRRWHGHTGNVRIRLTAKEVDAHTGMVVDFGELDWVKQQLDDWLDHRTIIGVNDPHREHMLARYVDNRAERQEWRASNGMWMRRYRPPDDGPTLGPDGIRDYVESFVVFSDVPTSERLAQFVAVWVAHGDVLQRMVDAGAVSSLLTVAVTWAETPSTAATYTTV